MAIATIDYETKRIEPRPDYPPIPVGVAIKYKRVKRYLAWGHPTENNCTKAHAKRVLHNIYNEADSITFHNAAFDIYVGTEHMGLPFPREYDDTLFLAYLHDPRDETLSLKPLADKYLDMPPEEQTKLKEWILANIPEAKRKPTTWGAYIAEAPGKLVGRYAVGDVVRTEALRNFFYPYIRDNDMLEAYEREKGIMPIVEEHMSSQGIRVAVRRLKKDIRVWERTVTDLDNTLRRKLKCGPDVNLGSNTQLADVMDAAGLVDNWILTDKGNRSTKRENLNKVCKDKDITSLLAVKGQIETCLTTFALPWLDTAEHTGGYIYPAFNQVRATDEYGNRKNVGTKTGRFSSSNPNLQNVPNKFEDVPDKYRMLMPIMRDYLIPDEGCCFIGRDYSQQEMRILAHYENGLFMQQYLANPHMDAHELLQQLIYDQTGMWFERKPVKNTGFGIIYGMGLEKLARAIKGDKEEARMLKGAYMKAVPGVQTLNKDLKKIAGRNEPIYTWGGRQYYCEEPKRIGGVMRSFEYKMLNLLIQGGAADCTKEAMIRYADATNTGRLTVQVHDELLVNAPKADARKEMRLLKDCMESIEFDVPMLSDGAKSAVSWARMKPWGN